MRIRFGVESVGRQQRLEIGDQGFADTQQFGLDEFGRFLDGFFLVRFGVFGDRGNPVPFRTQFHETGLFGRVDGGQGGRDLGAQGIELLGVLPVQFLAARGQRHFRLLGRGAEQAGGSQHQGDGEKSGELLVFHDKKS